MVRRVVIFVFFTLTACGEEDVPAEAPPKQLTFTEIQTAVFDKGCAFNGCHGAARAGGLVLTAGQAYQQLVGVAPKNVAAGKHGWKRVAAGDTANSYLLYKLRGPTEHAPAAPVAYEAAHADDGTLGDRMPPNSPGLASRTVAGIALWIEAGAPND